jgi:Protein of unknown function (DUF2384)
LPEVEDKMGVATGEFTMTEKRKPPSRDRLPPVAQILADLDSPEPSRREQVIRGCWEVVPHVGAILAALLRGLNDADEVVRLQAAKGLLLAFPGAETALSRQLSDIESNEPKVRLAAIERVITILTNFLGALSGIKPEESSITGRQPNPVTEDLMKHAGRWVAWTRDRQQVLAVADSFADALKQALAAGEPDPYVKKAPGASPKAGRKPFAILEEESPNIIDDVRKVFPNPDAWLDAPNDSLGGAKPRDLISTQRESEVRYLLRAIEDGITT